MRYLPPLAVLIRYSCDDRTVTILRPVDAPRPNTRQ